VGEGGSIDPYTRFSILQGLSLLRRGTDGETSEQERQLMSDDTLILGRQITERGGSLLYKAALFFRRHRGGRMPFPGGAEGFRKKKGITFVRDLLRLPWGINQHTGGGRGILW